MTREEAIKVLGKIKDGFIAVHNGNPVVYGCSDYAIQALDRAIEALSVDLVRCKECKHGKVETEPRRPWEGDITCKLDCTDREWYKGDFCSYGERRSDDNTI